MRLSCYNKRSLTLMVMCGLVINNRLTISRRAYRGSGGVGVLVKQSLLNHFSISILDSEMEGILWLQFVDTVNSNDFSMAVCYLPPANSSRGDVS